MLKRRTGPRVWMVIPVAVMLLVAACGGGSDSTTTVAETSASTTASTAEASTELDLGVDEIVIGVTFPLSGPIGFIGVLGVNSMQLEVDRINAEGGVGGAQLRLEVRDDELDPAKAVANVREFAAIDNLGLEVGSILSFMVEAVKPVLAENNIVSCQPIVEVPNILDGAPLMFRNQDPDQFRLPRLLEYLSEKAGVTTIGLIYEDDPAGQSLDANLEAIAADYGLEYLGAQFFQMDDTTHIAQMNALKEADVLLLSSNPTTAGITANAAKEVNYDGILAGFSGLHGFTFVEGAGDAVLGTILVANDLSYYTKADPDVWAPAYRRHVDAVVEAYGTMGGEQPYEMYSGTVLAADCVKLYVEAVKKAGTFQGAAVAEAWEQLRIPRAEMPSGVDAQFSPDDHEAFAAEDLWIYRWTQFEDGTYGLEVVDPAANATDWPATEIAP